MNNTIQAELKIRWERPPQKNLFLSTNRFYFSFQGDREEIFALQLCNQPWCFVWKFVSCHRSFFFRLSPSQYLFHFSFALEENRFSVFFLYLRKKGAWSYFLLTFSRSLNCCYPFPTLLFCLLALCRFTHSSNCEESCSHFNYSRVRDKIFKQHSHFLKKYNSRSMRIEFNVF